jgi:VIT1/CCC1 family predicted Fe2+/Mn2+ transporter
MALTRIGTAFDFLTGAAGNVIQKTISKRYSSENEVLESDGDLSDVIYSGAETVETETAIGSNIGTLAATGNTITNRVRVEFSNEDVAKTVTEKTTFDFGAGAAP